MERRRSIRIHEALEFHIGHGSYDTRAVSTNISLHGAMCFVDKSIPVMTQVEIALSLPGNSSLKPKKLNLKGVVVRIHEDRLQRGKFSIAIYFSEMKPADKKTLQNFIEHRLKA